MRHHRQLIFFALLAIALGWGLREVARSGREPEGFGTMLKEIQSADDTFTGLTPSDSSVYFIYTSANSNLLAYIDHDHTNINIVAGGTNISSIYRFSDSQDQLVIQIQDVQFADHYGSLSERLKWLAIVNTKTKTIRRMSTNTSVQESNPIWLSTNEIIFESVNLSGLETKRARRYIDLKTMRIEDPALVPHLAKYSKLRDLNYSLSPGGPGKVLLRSQDSLELLDIRTGDVQGIVPGLGNLRSTPAWVNVRSEGDAYLFCATPSDSTNRLLFRGRLGSPECEQLSKVHSYNGKWLSDENSFAFVASTNNCFFLKCVFDGKETNLFTEGWCRTFTPSPDGTRVFAEASIDSGPCGLWEFNVPLARLRQILPGNKLPFQKTRITNPRLFRVPSFDGFEVPVYRFGARSRPDGGKSAIVIAVPPRTDQCNRYYQTRPQFLSNLGFDYFGINYRGCDGYGTASGDLYSPEIAAKDVISVARVIVSRFGRPGRPVFLIAQSEGGTVLERIIQVEKNMWKACALVRTVPLERSSFENLPKQTPMLFVIGRNDPAYPSIRALGEVLKSGSRPVTLDVIDNYTHLNVDPAGRELEEAAVARFFLKNSP